MSDELELEEKEKEVEKDTEGAPEVGEEATTTLDEILDAEDMFDDEPYNDVDNL